MCDLRMFTRMVTRCFVALFACSLSTVGCAGCGTSRPEVTAKNECIAGGGKVFVHVLIRANYTRGPLKTSRDLWQFSCSIFDRSCKGVSLALDNLDRGHAITMMDLNTPEGAEVESVVGNVVTLRWGPWRTFTVDFSRGRVSYDESGPTSEGKGEANCTAVGLPESLRPSKPSPSYEREPTPMTPTARPDVVMPVGERVSCFRMNDMQLKSVSMCAFNSEGCKATAKKLGIRAECRPADSMACASSINGLACFGDMTTCMLKSDAADQCMEVRYTELIGP